MEKHSDCKHETTMPEMNGSINLVTIHAGELKFSANETSWVVDPGNYIMLLPHDPYGVPSGVRTIIPFTEIVIYKEVMNSEESIKAYEEWFALEHGMTPEEASEMQRKGALTKVLMDMGIDPDSVGGSFGGML